MTRVIGLCLFLLAVAACAGPQERPSGIGRDTDDLKQSPCACTPFYVGGKWVG